MFWGEFPMLDCRLEALEGHDVRTVLVEAPWTHRGMPKPLLFIPGARDYPGVIHVVDDWQPDVHSWTNEHHQRNTAWKIIDAEAADDDVVLICDLDEIPSPGLLGFAARWGAEGPGLPVSVPMRTFLFAVDWEVKVPLPPTCVVAPVSYLRKRAANGEYLAEVRDGRGNYLLFANGDDPADKGGWHFSWCGGPERQRVKLETATCHTEILSTPEADLIRSGARWRSREDGGGLPVVPVDVDETWPAYVHERRCPPEWFRPRGSEKGAAA
jgi:hypothetical protein